MSDKDKGAAIGPGGSPSTLHATVPVSPGPGTLLSMRNSGRQYVPKRTAPTSPFSHALIMRPRDCAESDTERPPKPSHKRGHGFHLLSLSLPGRAPWLPRLAPPLEPPCWRDHVVRPQRARESCLRSSRCLSPSCQGPPRPAIKRERASLKMFQAQPRAIPADTK